MINHPNRSRSTVSVLAGIHRRFPTPHAALAHLETIRWGEIPTCPYCNSVGLRRKIEAERAPRWQCSTCGKSSGATAGTVFHNSHVDLRAWFFVITMMLKSRGKVMNVSELARDLDMRRATVAEMIQRLSVRMTAERRLLTRLVTQRP